MVIYALDALKNTSKTEEKGIETEIIKVLQQASDRRKKAGKVKDRNDEILDFDLVFVGQINTDFNFSVCFY